MTKNVLIKYQLLFEFSPRDNVYKSRKMGLFDWFSNTVSDVY